MQLYMLMFGRSKKKMKPIMIDAYEKCERYMKQREKTKGSKAAQGWHSIIPAEKGAIIWRQKSATVGGNRCEMVQRVGYGPAGYIGRDGFNAHT